MLGLTWAGLAPADRASFAWRLPSFDHLVSLDAKTVEIDGSRVPLTSEEYQMLELLAHHLRGRDELRLGFRELAKTVLAKLSEYRMSPSEKNYTRRRNELIAKGAMNTGE